MQNVGAEQFDYGTFKAAYDTDARVKSMIKNFSQYGIEPKTKNELQGEEEPTNTSGTGAVDRMAKRATDLSDLN